MKSWEQKILNFHDSHQSLQLTSASQSALVGKSAGTALQATLKAILQSDFFFEIW